MNQGLGKYKHTLFGVMFVLFFLSSYLGVATLNLGMGDEEAVLVDCPFVFGHSMAICEMNPMEHLQEWQSMFTMLPSQNVLLALFALLALLLARKFHSTFSIPEPPLTPRSNRPVYTQSFQIFDPLKEAFSSGILNPKLF